VPVSTLFIHSHPGTTLPPVRLVRVNVIIRIAVEAKLVGQHEDQVYAVLTQVRTRVEGLKKPRWSFNMSRLVRFAWTDGNV
jgi:hypothetical protein